VHKAAESAFSALAQSGLGLWFDRNLKAQKSITSIMLAFLAVNVLQLAVAAYLQSKLRSTASRSEVLPEIDETLSDDGGSTAASSINEQTPLVSPRRSGQHPLELHCTRAMRTRGRAFTATFYGFILFTWAVFISVALTKTK
jgi:hypothetical protein